MTKASTASSNAALKLDAIESNLILVATSVEARVVEGGGDDETRGPWSNPR